MHRWRIRFRDETAICDWTWQKKKTEPKFKPRPYCLGNNSICSCLINNEPTCLKFTVQFRNVHHLLRADYFNVDWSKATSQLCLSVSESVKRHDSRKTDARGKYNNENNAGTGERNPTRNAGDALTGSAWWNAQSCGLAQGSVSAKCSGSAKIECWPDEEQRSKKN